MVKWIIIPIILLVILFTGWFLSKISKMADEFYQYAAIVDNKIDNIKTLEDFNDALDAYNILVKLSADTLGKGTEEIARLSRRLQEVKKQFNSSKHGEIN